MTATGTNVKGRGFFSLSGLHREPDVDRTRSYFAKVPFSDIGALATHENLVTTAIRQSKRVGLQKFEIDHLG